MGSIWRFDFCKDEYYWQEGKPYIDELVYKVVDDDNQALNQLLAGEIDGIEDLSLSNASNVDGMLIRRQQPALATM